MSFLSPKVPPPPAQPAPPTTADAAAGSSTRGVRNFKLPGVYSSQPNMIQNGQRQKSGGAS